MFMEAGFLGTDWDSLRRHAREIESGLEQWLPEFAAIASGAGAPLTKDADEARLASLIESGLVELREIKDQMTAHVDRGGTAANKAVLQRYREVVFDVDSEYKRAATKIARDRDREALLSGSRVRGESSKVGDGAGDEHMEPLLRERKTLGSTIRGVADIITQGIERQSLGASDMSVRGIVGNLPSIDDIITAMQRKKTRDNVIIGTTVGCCVSFLLWAIFH